MPRVSVIIPTFNCARFVGHAIRSVLTQTYTDYEIIVVDDGSTDETRDVVGQFDGQVRYSQQANRGPNSARNLAISQASGELFAYLDADDLWCPTKLKQQVNFLDAHKECGLVHCDATLIDEKEQILYRSYLRDRHINAAQGHCSMELLRHNTVLAPTVVMERRSCLEGTGGFDERAKGAADYFEWTLVAIDGMALGYIDEPLATCRRWTGNLSNSPRQEWEGLVWMFEVLLNQKSLAARFGHDAAAIVQDRLYTVQLALAYLDRAEGRTGEARRRVMSLLHEWPWQTDLYVEWLKACVPPPVAARLRRLREMWA